MDTTTTEFCLERRKCKDRDLWSWQNDDNETRARVQSPKWRMRVWAPVAWTTLENPSTSTPLCCVYGEHTRPSPPVRFLVSKGGMNKRLRLIASCVHSTQVTMLRKGSRTLSSVWNGCVVELVCGKGRSINLVMLQRSKIKSLSFREALLFFAPHTFLHTIQKNHLPYLVRTHLHCVVEVGTVGHFSRECKTFLLTFWGV